MRKTLLIIPTLLATALTASAQEEATTVRTYTDDLVVTIDGESTEPMETTVQVYMLDGNKINFVLSNFILRVEGEDAPVGNIEVNDIDLIDEDGLQTFTYQGNITIPNGDLEGVDFWLGTLLGEVPLDMNGKMTEDQIYLTIAIDMTGSIGQYIYVTFGSDFTDAIASVRADAQPTYATAYDLSGRRASDAKGIYIINGKKVLRK